MSAWNLERSASGRRSLDGGVLCRRKRAPKGRAARSSRQERSASGRRSLDGGVLCRRKRAPNGRAARSSCQNVSGLATYRGLDRRIYVLAAARAVNTMGFSIVMPFMAMYLVEKRGASGATYGFIYF